MNKSRCALTLVFVSVLLITTVTIVSARQPKVDVCHITGTYDFGNGEVPIGHVINIAAPAFQKHLDHGDLEDWDDVTLPDGSEVCTPPEEETSKVIFVTSLTYTGDLGGLDGADAICQTHAEEAELVGTYRAWLSTPETSACDRLNNATVPYMRPDGAFIADDWADLTGGHLKVPINVDENGTMVTLLDDGAYYVWTGTRADGTAEGTFYPCSPEFPDKGPAWTYGDDEALGTYGSAVDTEITWTFITGELGLCSSFLRLYCVEQ